MKSYKDFKQISLGSSDVSSVVVRDVSGVRELSFGGDGSYRAYECFGNDVEIGEHYSKILELKTWVKIYDDNCLVYDFYKKQCCSICTVYRAGDYGCIIHWHN